MNELNYLFRPNSIAVVGVSDEKEKIGSVIFKNILDGGYKGNLFPVNPHHTTLFNKKCYKTISEIPEKVDLIIVAIPAEFVIGVIEDAGKKEVKAAIIISAGFKETGTKGAKMERQLIEVAKRYGIRILGPNCLGTIVPSEKLNATFAASNAIPGNIAFLSQSGALCTAILDMSLDKNLGFSHFLSLGNKADINENELIDLWSVDPEVEVIGAYLEEITDGQELIKKRKDNKPVIILKPGLNEKAAKAIASHTGSLVQQSEFFKTAIAQNGFIEAETVEQMFNLMMSFSWAKPPKGANVAIITNAGGPGIIATDEVIKQGLTLADLSTKTQNKLKEMLPPSASVSNPIDVIGDALAERYKAPLDILIKQKSVDAIIVILTPQLITQTEETAELIIKYAKETDKPIFAVFSGGPHVKDALQKLYENHVPTFTYINDAVDVLSRMYKYFITTQQLKSAKFLHNKEKLFKKASKGKYRTEVRKYISNDIDNTNGMDGVTDQPLPEKLVEKLARECGIRLVEQKICTNQKEALKFANKHYPVVIKATTASIVHKTDKKAIYLNIDSQHEFVNAYNNIVKLIKKQPNKASNNDGPKEIDIMVQKQVNADQEIFIGAKRDGSSEVYADSAPGFGHLLTFGTGGIYTEIIKDLGFVLVPSNKEELISAFEKTKLIKIIRGTRNQPKLALQQLIKTIESVQQLVLLYPEISSLDINPLMLDRKKALVADLKIFVKR